MEGDDEKEFVKYFNQIVFETAKFICPTDVELAGRPREFDHEKFANKAVYQAYSMFLVEHYEALGSTVMIDDYKRKRWGDMKQKETPGNFNSPANKNKSPRLRLNPKSCRPTSDSKVTEGLSADEDDEINMDKLSEAEATKKYGYLRVGWVSVTIYYMLLHQCLFDRSFVR